MARATRVVQLQLQLAAQGEGQPVQPQAQGQGREQTAAMAAVLGTSGSIPSSCRWEAAMSMLMQAAVLLALTQAVASCRSTRKHMGSHTHTHTHKDRSASLASASSMRGTMKVGMGQVWAQAQARVLEVSELLGLICCRLSRTTRRRRHGHSGRQCWSGGAVGQALQAERALALAPKPEH